MPWCMPSAGPPRHRRQLPPAKTKASRTNDRPRGYASARVASLRDRISLAWGGYCRQPVTVIDPAIESHYGAGYERSRLFPGGSPSLEFVRSMELLERLLPPPPARIVDVGGGPGAYAAGPGRVSGAPGGSRAAARGAGTAGGGRGSGRGFYRRRGRRAPAR